LPPSTPHRPALVVVFGDQLDPDSPALRASRFPGDTVFMAESVHESRHVPSHIQRTVLFLAAMRHFAQDLHARAIPCDYTTLDHAQGRPLDELIADAATRHHASIIRCVEPGEWRIRRLLEALAARLSLKLEILPDTHFIATPDDFRAWASTRSSLTMEYFYREQRRRTGYLMEGSGPRAKPRGGQWNLDHDNRESFGKHGPSPRPRPPLRFEPDAITRATIADVRRLLPNLPGSIDSFAWPVTRADALAALRDFIDHRLPLFGPFEDAMWSTEPILYHSTLSAPLNLKLLNPRECCEAAIDALNAGLAPLASVEGFVRQIIGWREYIRGIYTLEGPAYADRNGLDQHGKLPWFYWNAETDMNCLRTCISQVLSTGFGHHIQRLMVTGNFALLAGVHPRAVSDWYLGMFIDGVDWVTLPNALGMVMHADARVPGGPALVGTKPYVASGAYIDRMSNYCQDCRYNPAAKTGDDACPFTVFYWDFLIRNRERFASNQRMTMILKNVDRMPESTRMQVTISASSLRLKFGVE
jgi:deoxyribodipyrimidine photolyase-related protein